MLCAIIGFGTGLGAAYAETFANAGYDIALLSRSGAGVGSAKQTNAKVEAYTCDVGEPDNLRTVLHAIEEKMGTIDVAIYNADLARFGSLDDVSEEQFEQSWRVGTFGLFATAKFLGPRMAQRGAGSIIISGATAALRGNLWTTAFASSKAAQRNLAQSLAKQLGPKGVHIGYLVIDGVIDTKDTRQNFAPDEPDDFFMDPKAIADAALMLVNQNKSAWTFELDLRPFKEKW